MLGQSFYFQTIRRTLAVVCGLFTNVIVSRYSNNGNEGNIVKTIVVPLRYANTDKMLNQRNEKIEPGQAVRTRMQYPRMSISMSAPEYDPSRQFVKTGRTTAPDPNNIGAFLSQLNPAPFNLYFELNIIVKQEADGLEILEQILPNFAPSFNLPIKDIPELQIVKDVPLILENVTKVDTYEGSPADQREVIYTLTFKAKIALYPPIADVEVIKHVKVFLYNNEAMTNKIGEIDVDVVPEEANRDDPHEEVVTITEE